MASASRTTADAILKEDYQPGIREQLNNDIPLLTYAEKRATDTDGRRAVLALHMSRNQGAGARAEGGTLPTAGSQGYVDEVIPVFSNYQRGKISGQLIRSADRGSASFINALDAETDGMTTDLKRDVNRQLWGTSDGVIAGTDLTTSSLQVKLVSTATYVQFEQLEVGMPVDIGTVAAPTLKTSNNAIVRTGGAGTAADPYWIELTAVATTTGTDFIFRTGNGGSGASQKELTGVQSIVAASGTLWGVNPTTWPKFVSTVKSNLGTNRAVTESLMAQTVHAVNRQSGKWPNLATCSDGVQRAFAAHLMSTKRSVNTLDLHGGYGKGIDFIAGGGTSCPVTIDRDCPANRMFFFSTDRLIQFEMSDWEFMDMDGSVLSRVANEDAYEMTLFKYHEFATDRRNVHGMLSDLTEA